MRSMFGCWCLLAAVGCSKEYDANPVDFCAPVTPAHAPNKGGTLDEAWVTMIEFADFQCPYCAKVQPKLANLVTSYGSQLRLVFVNAPLEMHAYANGAARAGFCAHAQDPTPEVPADPDPFFWAMHDKMFEPGANLNAAGLRADATEIGLEIATWNSCMTATATAEAIAQDIEVAAEVGLTATPMFLINGKPLVGNQDEGEFRALIDAELATAQASGLTQQAYYDSLTTRPCE